MAEERKSKGTDSPLCKLCGHRHRFRDPHVFGNRKAAEAPKAVQAKAALELATKPVSKKPAGKKPRSKRRTSP